MSILKSTFLFITLLGSLSLQAEHCKYLSAKYAYEAFQALAAFKASESLPIVDKYCEPCNDPYVKPVIVEEIEYRPYQVKGFAAVAINGEEVDLAYYFLNGKNLGFSHHCKTKVASEFLFHIDEEKESAL